MVPRSCAPIVQGVKVYPLPSAWRLGLVLRIISLEANMQYPSGVGANLGILPARRISACLLVCVFAILKALGACAGHAMRGAQKMYYERGRPRGVSLSALVDIRIASVNGGYCRIARSAPQHGVQSRTRFGHDFRRLAKPGLRRLRGTSVSGDG